MPQLIRTLFVLCLANHIALPTWAYAEDAQIKLIWELPTENHLPQSLLCDKDAAHLFVALKTGGVAVIDIRDPRPKQLAVLEKHKLADLDAMNLALAGDRLYVALGDFFGRKSPAGLAIIDVANTRRPKLLSVWKSDDDMEGSAVVVVSGNHAFLGAMSKGVMTFDISDPRAIKHLTTMQPDINFPRRNPNAIQRPNARGMALDGELLLVAYDAGGLRALDVSDPEHPREIGQYINEAMQGKQQAYNNIVIDGKRAFIAVDYAGLEVVDISNPRKMQQIGWWNPWKADTLQNLWFNSPGHINQLVLDQKHKQILLSAGDSELQIVDVSSPRRPQLFASYGEPKNGLGVWGLTTSDRHVYLSYIKTLVPFRGTWSGIKAVDLRVNR